MLIMTAWVCSCCVVSMNPSSILTSFQKVFSQSVGWYRRLSCVGMNCNWPVNPKGWLIKTWGLGWRFVPETKALRAPHQTAIFCPLRKRQMWRSVWTERMKRVMRCWRQGVSSWMHQCDINWILHVGGPVHVNMSEAGPSLSKAQQLPLFHPNNGFSYTVEIIIIRLSFINKLLMSLNSQSMAVHDTSGCTHQTICAVSPAAWCSEQFKWFQWKKRHCFTPCFTLTIRICSLFWGVEPIPAPVIGWEAPRKGHQIWMQTLQFFELHVIKETFTPAQTLDWNIFREIKVHSPRLQSKTNHLVLCVQEGKQLEGGDWPKNKKNYTFSHCPTPPPDRPAVLHFNNMT